MVTVEKSGERKKKWHGLAVLVPLFHPCQPYQMTPVRCHFPDDVQPEEYSLTWQDAVSSVGHSSYCKV